MAAVPFRSALREVGLNFYDHRAVVVEVVARLDGLRAAAARREPLYAQQLMALEALQVYAPMGHALGLDAVSAELEDCCFQVPCCAPVLSEDCEVPLTSACSCGAAAASTASDRRLELPTERRSSGCLLPGAWNQGAFTAGVIPVVLPRPGRRGSHELATALTVQVLFPESYAETAAWLRKEVVANAEILRRCETQLDEALQSNAQLRDLVADVKVSPFACKCISSFGDCS